MKEKLLFYYTNSKSVLLSLVLMLLSTFTFAQNVNLAPAATASASTCNTGACSTLNDLNFGTCGTQQMWLTSAATNPGSSVFIQFTWTSTQVIKGLTIHAGASGTRYLGGGTIQAWNGSAWNTVTTFTQTNTSLCNYNIDFLPVATTQLRIIDIVVLGSQTTNVNFREIEIWQGSIANNDIGVAAIDSPTTFCSNTQNIVARVVNFGKNQVTGFNVNWSINGVLQTPILSSASLDTAGGVGSNNVQILLGSYNFPNGVLTQVKAWTSNPNNTTDTLRNNDTTTVNKAPAMSGVYTIAGTAGPTNFATIDDAINALNFAGVCGPVTFNIAAGTYNRTTPIVLGDISGTSSINTITFDGGNALNCRFTGNLSAVGLFQLNNSKYINVRNITVENMNATTPIGMALVGSTRKVTLTKLIVRTPVLSSTSTSGYCINITGSTAGNGVTACAADSITIDSCRTIGAGYGICEYGQSSNASNRGHVYSNNIIDSCNYMGIRVSYNYNPVIVTNNTIYMQGWNYGYYGMYFYYNQSNNTTVPHLITGNKIYNFGYYGIYCYWPLNTTTAAAPKIENNVISSFTSGSYSGFYGLYLYNNNAACRADIYHNTIVMNGVQTSTTASCFYNTGSNVLNVKNNIFAVYSGSYTPAYFATSPTGNTVNYNLYWNATNTTTGNLVYRGTFFNPNTYLSATAGGDTSYNTAPSFISRVNNNFSLLDGCNGFGFAGLTLADINGTTRSLTTPNVGAYEFTGGVANNLAVMAILNPTPPIATGAQDLRFTVKNVGNNSISTYTASFSLNNGTPVSIYPTNTIAPCSIDTAVFTGANQITMVNVNNLSVYTSSPNSMTDADASNDTLKTTLYAPLSGTYTVGGANPDFATPAAAAAALQYGVSSAVVFDVRQGSYPGQILIPAAIPGASATNSVTFEGNDKNTRSIVANVSSATILVNQASYVRFRNLSVTNLGSGAGIGVVGTSTSFAGTGTQIVNCNVNVPIQSGTSSTGYGIIFTGTTNAGGISALRADSVLVDSCTITGGGYSLVFYGASNALYNRGNVFTNNTINNSNYMGGYIGYQYNPVIVENNTFNMQGQNYGYYGLYFYNNINSSTTESTRITKNRVNNFGGYGIYVYAPQAASTGAPVIITNNVVNGNSTGTSYPGYYGIYLYQNNSANVGYVLNNSVAMLGQATSTTYTCFYNTGSANTYVRSNIFVVNNGTYTPAYFATNVTPATAVNHNIYYNATNPTTGNVIYRGTFYNPTNFKTNTIGGDSSFAMFPPTATLNSFVLTNGCFRGDGNNGLVTTDIVGTTRSANPNIGAYEYAGVSLDLQVEAMPYPQTPIALGSQDLALRIRNNGTTTVTSFNAVYRLNNGTPIIQNWSGTLAACDTVTVVFGGANQINLGTSANVIKAYVTDPNFSTDGNPSNDTINVTLNPPLNGNYIVGPAPSDFVTINAAVNAIPARGVAGNVVFNIKTGTYNEAINLVGAIGAGPNSTITFKSQANHVDSVIITNASQQVVNFGATANYYIFDRVTLNQPSTTNTYYVIRMNGTASFDTIKNCKITAPMYNGSTVTASHYLVYATPYLGNGFAFINNIFDGGYYQSYIWGSSRTAPFFNMVMDGNTFNNFYYAPINYFYYSNGLKITNNIFNQNVNGVTSSYMYHYYCDSGFVYLNNIWNGISGKNLYAYYYYTNNAPSNKSIIGNNRFGGSSLINFYTGNTGTNNQDIVHNTLSTGTGYFYVAYATTLQPNFRVMNNVFTSTGTNAYYFSAAPSALYMTSDYNLVASNGTTPYYATANRTLPVMRTTYPGLERNSINYRAAINATTLVPLANDTAVWAINGRGMHIGYALNDRNNVARPQSAADGVPDLGAFEVTPTSIPPMATALSAPVAGATQVFLFGTDTVAKITYDAFANVPTDVTVRQYTGVRNPQANANQMYTNVYNDVTANGLGNYLFNYEFFYKDAMIGTNPNESELRAARYANGYWSTYTSTASIVDTVANEITIPMISDFGSIIGTNDLNPLPVRLTTFTGRANNSNADLTWTTANERNSSYFEVYTSTDGRNFRALDKVRASGNSNTARTYAYNHVNALKNVTTVYYKLKMVDLDGSFTWSNVVTLNAKARNAAIEVYPNPFTADLTISAAQNTEATVEIFNLAGVKVYSASVNAANGLITITDLSTLNAGVYFVKVSQNGETIVEKLVKQ